MKKFLLMCFSFGFVLCAWAQDRVVTGKLTSKEDGSALPGVNVVLKGTTNGTVTDSEGKYKIAVPSGATLVFSFIGMGTEEITVGERTVVDVSLNPDIQQLSEVVVTVAGGLQAREKELGVANTVINSDALTAGKSMNVAGGLQGKVAGLQINATDNGVNPNYRIVLRGQRSITGDNQALIVLDNVIVPSSVLAGLNQNDIESINILQGAGAAALYGSLASNGAMIITTKKGKAGKTEVNFSQNIQFQQVAFLPKIQTGFGAGGSSYGTNPAGYGYFNYLENQSYGDPYDGTLRKLGPPLQDGSQLYTTYTYKPGHSDFWNVGAQNMTDFSMSTGDDKSKFFVSGQFVTLTGTTPGDKFSRGTVRINGSRKLTEKVIVSFATTYNPSRGDISSATASIYNNMLNMPSNVDITAFKDWRNNKFATPDGFYNPWYLNPYFTAENFRQKDKGDNLTANLEFKFTPVKGLDIIARQGISSRLLNQKYTNGQYIYQNYSKITDQSSKADIPASVTEVSNLNTQLITDLLTQYNVNIGKFNVSAVGGFQMIENNARYMATSIGGLVVAGLYNLSNGVGTPTYGESEYQTRIMGAYGKTTVSYKDFLFLTGTGRNDWDSRLLKSNRSFFYPSVEAAAILTEAIPSIKNNSFLSYLKIRGNISKTGLVNLGNSTDLGAYATKSTFSANNNGFPYGTVAGYSVDGQIVSNNLKPEFTNTYEFGFDMNLWNDRINTNVTYYHSTTSNQTIKTALSNSTGFSTLLTNAGQTQNTGVEISASVTAIQNTDWKVTVGGNYTYVDNKVNFITDLLPRLNLTTLGSAVSAAVAGQSFPVIMGYDYVRDKQGHVIVDGVTGLPSVTSSIVILGNATPKNRVGANAAIEYKGLRFSILFEYRGGYKIYNGIGPDIDWSGTGYRSAFYDRKSFVFPNSVIQNSDGSFSPNKTVAIANGGGNNGFWSDGINRGTTSNYVTSGEFIKLREVSLSYNLPSSLLAKTKFIKRANISIQGRNLFLWMAKDNYYTDPEYSSAGSTGNGMGLNDTGKTPPVRYFGSTLALTF